MFRPIFIGPPTKDRKVNQHQNSESIFLVTTIFSNSPIYIQLSNSPKTSSFKHLNPPWTNATFPNFWGSKCQVRCEGHRVGASRGWFAATAWTRGRQWGACGHGCPVNWLRGFWETPWCFFPHIMAATSSSHNSPSEFTIFYQKKMLFSRG